ncbi:MAG: type II/IV secretion system protein [Merismopedia sp. SIO2A8]|nr:type II/IV secretion system protein [Merismopedia sp. SIO2A8]
MQYPCCTYPSICGEKAVIRLLPQRNRFETLADLGFTKKALSTYRKWINEPHGVIIITGPTGSGKTSTLYASLREVSSEEKNTVTIEDPVEYTMPGITQGGVNPLAGMTFQTGLKSILRQDPDIIMVGEVRDGDTAATAIRAALTGHLVFTTVHTNDVVSVIPRLKGLGLDPDLISDSILGIVAQRLVRKVCHECGEPYEPTDFDLQFLRLTFENCNPQGWRKGSGCEKCFYSGFLGREAVIELLDIDEVIKQYIRKDEISKIYSYLKTIEFDSFHRSACEKVINGITTVSEIKRVLSSHAMRSLS